MYARACARACVCVCVCLCVLVFWNHFQSLCLFIFRIFNWEFRMYVVWKLSVIYLGHFAHVKVHYILKTNVSRRNRRKKVEIADNIGILKWSDWGAGLQGGLAHYGPNTLKAQRGAHPQTKATWAQSNCPIVRPHTCFPTPRLPPIKPERSNSQL